MTQFTHDTAPTKHIEAGETRFACQRFGNPGRVPLVFLNHFMGNLDDHDPAISDAFAADREVILGSNADVASSTGTVPDSVEAMARDAISFIDALNRIPGSLNVFMDALLNQADGTSKPVGELREIFVGVLSRPGRKVTCCRVGIAATSDVLALTLLGESDVAVYDGSLQEWTTNPELPLEGG